jgi:hypothetical protein
MKSKIILLNIVGLILIFTFLACNISTINGKSKLAQTHADTMNDTLNQKSGFETNQLSINEIKNSFTLCIKDFIETVNIKDKIHFDTLYFGKHVYGQPDDFPDIELPAVIANTRIILISPELGTKMQQANKNMVYINMMGWIDKANASFMLVTFSNGAQHQYDYFIVYDFNTTTKNYQLKQISLEDYRKLTENKPKKISLYSNGKYTF